MAKKKGSKTSGSGFSDPRFASARTDARFRLPSLKKNKVKVDDRFSRDELKKLNVSATGKKVKIDRYGRKINDDENQTFDKYFEEEKDSESGTDASSESEESSDSESDSDSEETKVVRKPLKKTVEPEVSVLDSDSDTAVEEGFIDRARGEGLSSSSDESDSDEEVEEEDSEIELEEDKPEEGDPTSAFAVVNMDWDNIRAVDLMATFVSFVPKGGSIKSVTIYPSEYGKEQMQKEEVEGPPKELFAKKKKKNDSDSDSDSDEELDLKNADDLEKAARKIYEEDDGEEDYDSKALRKYQLQRLRYYYAVVHCDSVSTAKNIYDNCDGSEYESTANTFDLRYVPEDMDFDDQEAKDQCDKIPASYRPDSTFVTDALQHSKVKLTWDQTPKERTTLSSRLFSQKEIDDMDFKAYLASDSEGSEAEQAELLKDKYKNLLGGKFSFDKGNEEEEDVDMEITFNPGLDENKAEAQPEEPKEESTIDAYKRKEKERRARRMEKFKEKQTENEPEKEERSGKKSKKDKKKNKKPQEVDEKSKAELELLLMEDDKDQEQSKAEHFDMRDILKAEKDKKSKKKNKKNKKYDTEMVQDGFKADLNDDRFKEIFESHDYAIDPTSSEFKKTDTMKRILDERSKRLRREDGDDRKSKKSKKNKHLEKTSEDNTLALTSLVAKLKNNLH